jgi:hypothetical protein
MNPIANVAIKNSGIVIKPLDTWESEKGGEIPAFDPTSQRVFVVAGDTVEIYTVTNLGTFDQKVGELTPGFTPPADTEIIPNSVTVKNGIVAVAYAIRNTDTGDQLPGQVGFFNATDGTFLNSVEVGSLPDMLTFTPDGTKILTANEGEPNEPYTFDPEGSISIIDLSNGVANVDDTDVTTADFTAFNSQIDTLRAQGVRIFGPNATVAQDLEPEYITVSSNSRTAYVTLQENNALAVVDIPTATVTKIVPLGFKDHSLPGNALDASDRDVNGTSGGGGKINIQNWTVLGMYQPDSIASYEFRGKTYLVTANEGDSRVRPTDDNDFGDEGDIFNEESRVNSLNLDPTVFPNAAILKQNQNLGRLTVTNTLGDTDDDGDYDQLYSFGGRSFSIRDDQGNLVFDSGDDLEQITASFLPQVFNSDGDSSSSFDSRSDNKGPEPEGVVVGKVQGKNYAFIGLERVGGVMVYDVTDPKNPDFVQYLNNRDFVTQTGDRGPEGLTFVSAENSPSGVPLLIVSNEVSNTTTIYEINPAPKTVVGSIGSDIFDVANPDGKKFIGNNQFLFTLNGDDLVDVSKVGIENNLIDTGFGNDTIYTGTNNLIRAGLGNDIIYAGFAGGNNTITGGRGNDQFWIVENPNSLPTQANIITDFTQNQDVIGLKNVGAGFGFGNLTLTQDGNNTVINAFGQDLAILAGVQVNNLTANDFVFVA